jgi:hypothetical protein
MREMFDASAAHTRESLQPWADLLDKMIESKVIDV